MKPLLPEPELILFRLGHGTSRQPDPELAELAQGNVTDVALAVRQAGRQDVVDRLERVRPRRRGGLDRELLEDVPGHHGRRGPRRRAEFLEAGSEGAEDL